MLTCLRKEIKNELVHHLIVCGLYKVFSNVKFCHKRKRGYVRMPSLLQSFIHMNNYVRKLSMRNYCRQ